MKTHTGKLQKSINLKNFQISNNTQGFKRVSTINGRYSLKHFKAGDYGQSDGGLKILKDGKTYKTIIRDSTNGLNHRCYGWYRDFIISGGSSGFLKIYNKQGREVANLVGHTSDIWSIALDGDRLVSGSDDQTIKVWDLKNLESFTEMQVTEIDKEGLAQKYGLKINDIIYAINDKKIKNIEKTVILLKKLGKYKFSIIRNNKKINIFLIKDKKGFGFTSNFHKTIKPQLNLFITKQNEWIAWTPQGFYNASKGAEQYIGYHIQPRSRKRGKILRCKPI